MAKDDFQMRQKPLAALRMHFVASFSFDFLF
jgi:hypothetical protein